jgi:hypothetical protein
MFKYPIDESPIILMGLEPFYTSLDEFQHTMQCLGDVLREQSSRQAWEGDISGIIYDEECGMLNISLVNGSRLLFFNKPGKPIAMRNSYYVPKESETKHFTLLLLCYLVEELSFELTSINAKDFWWTKNDENHLYMKDDLLSRTEWTEHPSLSDVITLLS